MEVKIFDNHFLLLPERAVYWQEQNTLILSDLHIGKSMHFRKGGIAIPTGTHDDDFKKLTELINGFRPSQMIVVGDMFHSHDNSEIQLFHKWRFEIESISFILAKGNHDILGVSRYADLKIEVQEILSIGDFVFAHECVDVKSKFCFSGHVHPGIRLNGMARQSVSLPCFHFTPCSCTLPAFSKFTGLYKIAPRQEDRVFAILENEIIEVPCN